MTGELIGNEIQPEGGIEEVLLPPIRAGLKRSLRERKTRLKDINYHLGRFALFGYHLKFKNLHQMRP